MERSPRPKSLVLSGGETLRSAQGDIFEMGTRLLHLLEQVFHQWKELVVWQARLEGFPEWFSALPPWLGRVAEACQ